MVYSIARDFCSKDKVLYTPLTDENQVIVGAEGVVYLKVGGEVLIDKFEQQKDSSQDYHDVLPENSDSVPEIFRYNSSYLDFSGSMFSYRLLRRYFFSSDDGALLLEEPVAIERACEVEETRLLTRTEIEAEFDRANYDAVFVLNTRGGITYVSSKKDKMVMGNVIIPSDRRIAALDCKNRLWHYHMAKYLGENFWGKHERKKPKIRPIEEIEEMPLYMPIDAHNYSHMLLTVQGGHFELKWFKIQFVKKDLFRLTVSPVHIKDSVIDDVIDFCTRNEVVPAQINVKREPNLEEKGKIIQFKKKDVQS